VPWDGGPLAWWTPLAEQVAVATAGKAESLMRALLAGAAKRAADEAAPLKARVAAVEQLRLSRFVEQQELLGSLLAPAVPVDLQSAALATLASNQKAFAALSAQPNIAALMANPGFSAALNQAGVSGSNIN
jgi:hypothetical protein